MVDLAKEPGAVSLRVPLPVYNLAVAAAAAAGARDGEAWMVDAIAARTAAELQAGARRAAELTEARRDE